MTDTDTHTHQAPPRLTRDPDGGLWLGVASGLARHLRIDPVIPRIAFVVLMFAGGLGLLLYVLGWLLLPLPGEDLTPQDTAATRLREAPTWLAAVVVVFGLLWIAGLLGMSSPGLVWGVALVGLGVLLFQQDTRRQQDAAPVPPPPAPPGTPPAGTSAAGAAGASGAGPAAAAEGSGATGPAHERGSAPPARPTPPGPPPAGTDRTATATQPIPPEPPAPPSILGRLTVAVALLVTGVAALVANNSAAVAGPRTYLGLLLVVVGAGLVVGAWWGRARWLIVVGLLLVPLALATGFRGLPAVAGGGMGERTWQPQSLAEVEPDYRLFAGQATVDLSRVELSGTTTIDASVALGQLTVLVPDDADVEVTGNVVAGEIMLFDRVDNGMFVDTTATTGTAAGPADLVLDVRGGFAQLEVVAVAPDRSLR